MAMGTAGQGEPLGAARRIALGRRVKLPLGAIEQEGGERGGFLRVEVEIGHANPRVILVRLAEERLQSAGLELRLDVMQRQPAERVALRRLLKMVARNAAEPREQRLATGHLLGARRGGCQRRTAVQTAKIRRDVRRLL